MLFAVLRPRASVRQLGACGNGGGLEGQNVRECQSRESGEPTIVHTLGVWVGVAVAVAVPLGIPVRLGGFGGGHAVEAGAGP